MRLHCFFFFLLLIARLKRLESYSVPFLFFLLSFFFCVVVFYTYIFLSNCYLIKCNKQQEKHSEKNSTPYIKINMWINNPNFCLFLQFTVGNQSWKPFDRFLNNLPTSSFYILIVIITFQHVNYIYYIYVYILLLLIARKLTFEYDQMRVTSKIPKNYKQKQ